MSIEALQWSLAFLIMGAVVVPYAFAFRRRGHAERARKEEAVRLGIDRPLAQFPFIDAKRCIGCGACVDACPEGDVLGVVGGTATVVNGLRCVGHGRCEMACPVGAIQVGLGDLKARQDIPLTDGWLESTVPGLFVTGELAGLALVKNAVAQSLKVIDRVAQLAPASRRAGGGDALDLLVVGAGPAGLAAAGAAHERGLSVAVLEQEEDLGGALYHYPRRKMVLVQPVELPLVGRVKEAEYAKDNILALFKELCRVGRLDVRFHERVVGVEKSGRHFSVRSSSGVTAARFVVLALGRRGTPRKLGVPGEELPKVMYQLVDAESYQGQRLLVVGGGDSAAEAAIGFARQPGNRVTLSYRREKLVRIKKRNEDRISELLAQGRIEGLFNSEVEEIQSEGVRLRTADGTRTIPNDYVFVFAGGEPPFALLRQMGVRFGGDPSEQSLSALKLAPSGVETVAPVGSGFTPSVARQRSSPAAPR
jgi:thioredoxin reductase/NAD-dependent dihydropyrimidine dehydrogenase PreA subunit